MEDSPLIEFKDVCKAFDSKPVLDHVSFEICEGQVTTIIGKSGTGKSVLLKHIIGLIKPDEGTICYKGKPIDEMSAGEWTGYISRISYMFQNNALFDSMNVFENVALPLRQGTKLKEKEIRLEVMFRIEQNELSDAVDKYPAELSGGMQKRVALARALVTSPSIVLFDEPTTGQDPIRRNAILSLVAEYQRKLGFTAVLVSHDLPDVFFISNRILVLHEGKVLFQGSPEELEQCDNPFVDEFVQSIEGFQERLTGLYSKRSFKVRYQTALAHGYPKETFTLITFAIDHFGLVTENVGHEKAQKIIKNLGNYINKHFVDVGGFSTRTARNLFVTVLPYSGLAETKQILNDFCQDLQRQGLVEIGNLAHVNAESCFEFFISAGLAEGKTDQDIESVVASAESRRKPIARFQCEKRSPVQSITARL
jgi:phospholipid/cholesterol/gamma-HCH transport system ATP-binding protein